MSSVDHAEGSHLNRPRDIVLLALSSETFKREMAVMIQTGISLDGETVFFDAHT